MNGPGHEAQPEGRDGATPGADAADAAEPRPTAGGDVRRQLDRAPGDRYRRVETDGADGTAGRGATRTRRLLAAAAVAVGTAVVTFALITFVDIGPGLLVLGVAGGWLTGLAVAGGARATHGEDAGRNRAITAAGLAGLGIALGLLLDSLRAYTLGGVLLPWEYALTRFGIVAPLAIGLAAVAGWLRGR